MTERQDVLFVFMVRLEVERKQSQRGCNLSQMSVPPNCKKGRHEEM